MEAPHGTVATEELTPAELRLAARNHALPLEALRYPITPVGLHYLLTHYDIPAVDADSWRLEIGGGVERPLSLSLDDLRELPRTEQVSDFHCVTGWSVENVHWAGIRFDDLLAEAGPQPEARWLQFFSEEVPYVDTLSLEQAFVPDAMLALDMDEKPLTKPHGFPTRVVMPRMYGYKGVKWVNRIHVRRDFVPGYWETHGYDSDAWIGKSNFGFIKGQE